MASLLVPGSKTEYAHGAAEAATARADAAHCERIARTHARTFALASAFLPARKRRAAFALYAFCRVADDLVDEAVAGRASGVAEQLAGYDRTLHEIVNGGVPRDPVFRELQWAVREYGVPEGVLHELVAGVARDLAPVRYESWPELAKYCEGVASTVGEMCTHVFGVQGGAADRDRALRYARILGVAMQLTNILRDVGEDARRGRCYLPEEDLAAFGLTPHEVLHRKDLGQDERWRPFMAFQIGRARMLYEAAMPGIALLAPDAQRCASACAVGYAGILGAIEAIGYDSVTTRARVGTLARASLLWQVWRSQPQQPALHAEGPAIRWDEYHPTKEVRWA